MTVPDLDVRYLDVTDLDVRDRGIGYHLVLQGPNRIAEWHLVKLASYGGAAFVHDLFSMTAGMYYATCKDAFPHADRSRSLMDCGDA